MTDRERKLALYCLKANSDYHSEVCEECIKYPNCDHTGQDDVTETIIKALEQEPVLDKIKEEVKSWYWQADKQKLAEDPCVVDAMIDLFIRTINKYKAESEEKSCISSEYDYLEDMELVDPQMHR